jgi:uncharacterized protein DUF3108
LSHDLPGTKPGHLGREQPMDRGDGGWEKDYGRGTDSPLTEGIAYFGEVELPFAERDWPPRQVLMNRLPRGRAWLSRSVAIAALASAGILVAGCNPGSSSSTASGSPSGGKSGAPTTHSSSPTPSSGGSGGMDTTLFPATVGNTWVYQNSSSGTTTNKVVSVTPDSDGQKVQISTDLSSAGTATTLTYQFYSDGSIGVPYVSTGSQAVTIKSGGVVWPSRAVLDSGQPHTSPLTIEIKFGGHSETVTSHVTVQGKGTQSVTVPAGTYQATVVSEKISEVVSGIKVNTVVTTWLAPGVGPVKSEVSTGEGTITTEKLTSFTKG